MGSPQLIYLFVSRWELESFPVFIPMDKVDLDIHTQVFVWTLGSFLLGRYLEMRLLGYMVKCGFNFLRHKQTVL